MAMKEIEFSEEGLGNLQDIAFQLFSQTEDPAAPGYRRKLIRPKICWPVVIAHCLVPPVLAAVLYWLLWQIPYAWIGVTLALVLYYVLTAKRAVICAVKIYQHFAPDNIRNQCRYEPSCSHYMIGAVEKYGVIRGVIKGCKRLRRCNINNGGIDMP